MIKDLSEFRPSQVRPVALGELVSQFTDVVLPAAAVTVEVRGASMDSLDLREGEVFIAVPGANVHAAKFAPKAYEAGAVAIITDAKGQEIVRELGVPLPVAVVEDPRRAASEIAMKAYGYPARELRTVAVTGTNGKTTTALALQEGMRAAGIETMLMSTARVQVGDYEYVSSRTTLEGPVLQRVMAFALERGVRGAVIETSAHALSLYRVEGIEFDSVGFTNLQHDHLDYYQTMERYFAAKALLFTPEHAKNAVIAVDDEWGQRLAERTTVPVTTVSAYNPEAAADWVVTRARNSVPEIGQDITLTPRSAAAVAATGQGPVQIHVPLPGLINAQNVVIAYLMLTNDLGLDADAVLAGLARLSVPGRVMVAAAASEHNPQVVVDYAHTPEALESLIETMRDFTQGRIVLVFGTDGDRDATKRVPLAEVAARSADVLWVTDENPRFEDAAAIRAQLLEGIANVRPDLEDVHEIVTCRRDAIREAMLAAQPQDLVLITGKGHEPYQEVEGVMHAFRDDWVVDDVVQAMRHDVRLQKWLQARR